jgi:hypothetical protein
MMRTPLEILLVLTSQATMGDDLRLTGVWFEEQSTRTTPWSMQVPMWILRQSPAARFRWILIP